MKITIYTIITNFNDNIIFLNELKLVGNAEKYLLDYKMKFLKVRLIFIK